MTSDRRLGSQLTILVALAMFFMVLCVSIGTSYIINQSLNTSFVKNGKNISAVFAKESALAVLSGSPDSAVNSIDIVQSFSGFSKAAIYEADGTLLVEHGSEIAWYDVADWVNSVDPIDSLLEYESPLYWQFRSPIYLESSEPELADLDAPRFESTRIGMVRVLISKDQLYSARNNTIIANVVVQLVVAIALVLALNMLSGTLTKPLEEFVDTMSSGARGEKVNLRVDLSGTRETHQLGNAFNQMMSVLEDRESQLASARDQALAAAKLKSEFAANVSHEIRTPLNGILGTLNLLTQTKLDANQQELISLAESSSESLMALINDILDFSRLSLDQSTLISTEFDLHQLIEELMFLHSQSVGASSIDVLMLYDPALPYIVESDPNKLRQLLNNLINNAVKFTDAGSVTIEARKQVDADGKVWIRIAVRDTGIGISKADQRKIFLPYSQSDGSMSRKYSGTGLGLAICDQLVELLHGDIGVFSELKLGSEFYVRIPFSYRSKVSASSLFELPEKNNAALIYGSTPLIVDAAVNICELRGFQATTFLDFSDLATHLSSVNPLSVKPVVIVYISSNGNSHLEWQALEKILDEFDLDTLVIANDLSIDLDRCHAVHYRPPLRTAMFATAMIRLGRIAETDGSRLSGEARVPRPKIDLLQGKKILLVEDNIVNQRVAKAMLETMGCIVVVAENGQESIDFIREADFDLIYMDCQMPVLNGYDATQEIRKMSPTKANTPIVAMTANVGMQDRAHCVESGMNDFLSKPVKLDQLTDVTLKWISATC